MQKTIAAMLIFASQKYSYRDSNTHTHTHTNGLVCGTYTGPLKTITISGREHAAYFKALFSSFYIYLLRLGCAPVPQHWYGGQRTAWTRIPSSIVSRVLATVRCLYLIRQLLSPVLACFNSEKTGTGVRVGGHDLPQAPFLSHSSPLTSSLLCLLSFLFFNPIFSLSLFKVTFSFCVLHMAVQNVKCTAEKTEFLHPKASVLLKEMAMLGMVVCAFILALKR